MVPKYQKPYDLPYNERNLLEKYGIPMLEDRWADLYEEPRAWMRKTSLLKGMRRIITSDEKMGFSDRLMVKIIDYRQDTKPSLANSLLNKAKVVLLLIILAGQLVFYVIPLTAWEIVKYFSRDPIDTFKFLGAVAIVGAVAIIEILLAIHAIYVACVIVLLLAAGAYFVVYNPYIAPSPLADLHLKTQDGKTAQITNNRSATDPTYVQVLLFLAQDSTDTVIGKYQTARVAAAVRMHDSAERQGIKAGVAEVRLDNSYAPDYCWNVFNTTDMGVVYVTSYHADPRQECDSLIYIPQSGSLQGQIVFIPVDQTLSLSYGSLNETMGRTVVQGKVADINVVW